MDTHANMEQRHGRPSDTEETDPSRSAYHHSMLSESDRCLSVCLPACLHICLSVCLSVTLAYCGQKAVGWIKMKLGMELGLSPGHIVLDGDPAPLPKRGTTSHFLAMSVVAKRLDGSRYHLVWR